MDIRTIERQARAIVRSAVKSGTWYETESMEGDPIESQFLGTVFALTPSGKFYTPWANSNVAACKVCKGAGVTDKVERIFTNYLGESVTVYATCKHCQGIGSREAYEDEVFNEALESAAEKYNCWIESGEGDPCDIFIVRAIESTDDNESE